MKCNVYIYISIMVVVTFLIRVLPLTLIREQIKNQFLRSFLYYVPYITLAVMTFPAILNATESVLAGALAFVIGIVFAWKEAGLFKVSISCCLVVFIVEMLIAI